MDQMTWHSLCYPFFALAMPALCWLGHRAGGRPQCCPWAAYGGPHAAAGLVATSVGLSEHGAGRVQECPAPMSYWGRGGAVSDGAITWT